MILLSTSSDSLMKGFLRCDVAADSENDSFTPPFMGQIVKFACLVGLRASEVVESVRLLNSTNISSNISGKIQYYNPERQALEHFRFPEIFLRQTKKAYISFVTPSIIEEIVGNIGTNITDKIHKIPTLNAIILACRHKGIKMEMYLTRKIFASYLRKEGIEPEIIDMLQGRV